MKIDINEQLNRGIKLLTEKQYDVAEGIFNALLNIKSDSHIVIFYLATLHMLKKHAQLAIILFKRALEIDSTSINAASIWNNLGFVYRDEQMQEPAIEAFGKAMQCAPNDHPSNADYLANLAAMYVARGTPDKALELIDKALKINPDLAVARWNRALGLLEKGDYEQGFKEYDYGTRLEDERRRDYGDPNRPQWDGTPGKTVIVYGEQGMGDEIMFASMLPDMMRDCNVIFDAHPRLADIFRNSFERLPVYGTRKDEDLYWVSFHKNIDAVCAIGSIAKFYRRKPEDFPGTPYLQADAQMVDRFRHKLISLGNKPKIGLSWKGGTKKTNINDRIIKLEQFLPIFDALDADYISLQYTEGAQEEIEEFQKLTGKVIHHWQDAIDDYDATAALVTNLDLIISVPQTVVHLAGALGVPTFQLTPKKAMWQMGVYGENMPWYSSVKNYWQDESETWEPVINEVVNDICKLSPKNIEN